MDEIYIKILPSCGSFIAKYLIYCKGPCQKFAGPSRFIRLLLPSKGIRLRGAPGLLPLVEKGVDSARRRHLGFQIVCQYHSLVVLLVFGTVHQGNRFVHFQNTGQFIRYGIIF